MRINIDRLCDDILHTAQFGAVQENGLTRLSFDQSDQKVRQWFETVCRDLGGIVRVDRAGNQYARFFSLSDEQPTILIGSHLDTQPDGGRFDGILGVLAGIEMIRSFKEKNYHFEHAIEIINWTNEEGARFSPPMMGSAYACGYLDIQTVLTARDKEGITLEDASEGFRSNVDILSNINAVCYLELHIEQGPILEAENINIGVVTSICGISWYTISFYGRAQHAGTTPLNYRNDSLIKSAKFITEFQKYIIENSENMVGTIGKIENIPNTPNTISQNTTIYIDIRSSNADNLSSSEEDIRNILYNVLHLTDNDFKLNKVSHTNPIMFSPLIIETLEKTINKIGLTGRRIISGAGHDALQLAKYLPTGMLFIPCKDGISHNPNESITKEDARNGTEALANTILNLDRII